MTDWRRWKGLRGHVTYWKGWTAYQVFMRLPDGKVTARGAMNSCRVEFEDGFRMVTSRNVNGGEIPGQRGGAGGGLPG